VAQQDPNNNKTDSFDRGLNTDVKDFHSKSSQWTFARNATNWSPTGDIFDISSEPSNKECIKAPYTIVGFIYLFADNWIVFSTNDVNSEIGRFVEGTETYTTIANDSYYPAGFPLLNFNRANLIIGVSKENFDCSWHIYWADGNNPDRTLNVDKPQFVQLCTDSSGNTQLGTQPPSSPFYPVGCITCVNYVALAPVQYTGFVVDTDAIRLAKLVNAPCLHVVKGSGGGSLFNGSYFVIAAYKVNGQRVTDYFAPSNVQPLFDHSNVAGSIDVIIDSMDDRFDEFELVVVSVVNQQTEAKSFGTYSTRQKRISIDIIDPTLTTVPLAWIPLHNPIADKSDAIYEVGNYLLRTSPTNKFDFNYQPLANQIVTKWVSTEFPADYYRKGGSATSRLRDENYCEFIQWIYDDGDLSSSYHIPGRPVIPITSGTLIGLVENAVGGTTDWLDPLSSEKVFEVYNTAQLTFTYPPNTPSPDGEGFLLSEGLMGYHESTEFYPDDKPLVYNASTFGAFTPPYPGTSATDYDLCGKPIRHHKFPEQRLWGTPSDTSVQHYTNSSPNFGGKPAIRILGTKYENIKKPLLNDGLTPVPGIVGYRILRGSREGNKTIVAKGIINNMFEYVIPGGSTTRNGLYPNYPYNDVGADYFITSSLTETAESVGTGVVNTVTYPPNSAVRDNVFTFHSPDTQFRNPYLSMKELKVYGHLVGTASGAFVEPHLHPRHKFVTDLAFVSAVIAGVGIAMISSLGQRTTTRIYPTRIGTVESGIFVGPAGAGAWGLDNLVPVPTTIAAIATGDAAVAAADLAEGGVDTGFTGGAQAGITALTGLGREAWNLALAGLANATNIVPSTTGYGKQTTEDDGDNVPTFLRMLNGIPAFVNYWSQGTDTTLDLIRAFLNWEQHALQYMSHCFYDGFANTSLGETRRTISDEIYLEDQLQDLGTGYRVNNLFRGKSVALQTAVGLSLLAGDNTKQTLHTATGLGPTHQDPLIPLNTFSICSYTALKNRLQNQYGQIGGVHQIPIGSCTISTAGKFPVVSPVLFGGDTYVSRYTEKNTMFFFYDWMYGQPNGYEFDYRLKEYVPRPMYWMDTHKWDIAEVISGLGTAFTTGSWTNLLPQSLHAFDRGGLSGFFGVKDAYMYLSNSGVRDFFVESDVNTELRDWGDNINQRYYDPYRYTDEKAMFDMNPDIIKAGNYFKYDYSLSISKLFPSFISWANIQPINYDPIIYESCFVHYKNRVLFSLPFAAINQQSSESIKDAWLIFLANNYHDFITPVTDIKAINKTGALFFFGNQSPLQMVSIENLQMGNTEITIGTGALFSRPLQSLVNAEKSFETASCQGRLSVINTPMGVYWISQSTGNIFQYQLGAGMSEISGTDLNWWFAQYLPCMLTQSFPDFELTDNPVIGVGTQSTFDQQNTLVYFMKKDYKLKDGFVVVTSASMVPNSIQYTGRNDFKVGGVLPIKLGDPTYFEDASFTASYDPKTKEWISFHDWKPELTMQGKNTFLTTQTDSLGAGGLYVHNILCDSYCNYFGVDYPFEVEFRVNTGQQVNVLRSIELQMENYLYDAGNCHDRYLMLEYFFDKAVIWNPEQCSGMLKFNPIIHNDPWKELSFPQYNAGSVDILYSKVENKYRFNQMVDLTSDRGEFSNARRMIWNTSPNGYVRALNNANLDYAKSPTEHKRFRNYQNSVWLRKDIVGKVKILLILADQKLQQSPR